MAEISRFLVRAFAKRILGVGGLVRMAHHNSNSQAARVCVLEQQRP